MLIKNIYFQKNIKISFYFNECSTLMELLIDLRDPFPSGSSMFENEEILLDSGVIFFDFSELI